MDPDEIGVCTGSIVQLFLICDGRTYRIKLREHSLAVLYCLTHIFGQFLSMLNRCL